MNIKVTSWITPLVMNITHMLEKCWNQMHINIPWILHRSNWPINNAAAPKGLFILGNEFITQAIICPLKIRTSVWCSYTRSRSKLMKGEHGSLNVPQRAGLASITPLIPSHLPPSLVLPQSLHLWLHPAVAVGFAHFFPGVVLLPSNKISDSNGLN